MGGATENIIDRSNQYLSITSATPEPGQLVEVRRRQWVVSDVRGQSFEANGGQHIVTVANKGNLYGNPDILRFPAGKKK